METTSGANITVTDDIRETRFNAAVATEITDASATTYQIDGRGSFYRIPTSATTTAITLPEIVTTGTASTNQVQKGYTVTISINRSVAVDINRSGSDVIWVNGQTSSNTTVRTTANTFFCKTFVATDVNEWTIVE